MSTVLFSLRKRESVFQRGLGSVLGAGRLLIHTREQLVACGMGFNQN